MVIWEYKYEMWKWPDAQKNSNLLGNKGWELVSVSPGINYTYYFFLKTSNTIV